MDYNKNKSQDESFLKTIEDQLASIVVAFKFNKVQKMEAPSYNEAWDVSFLIWMKKPIRLLKLRHKKKCLN